MLIMNLKYLKFSWNIKKRLLIFNIANLKLIKLMLFIFFILENKFVILKMYLDDFLILKNHFLTLENEFLILKNISFL